MASLAVFSVVALGGLLLNYIFSDKEVLVEISFKESKMKSTEAKQEKVTPVVQEEECFNKINIGQQRHKPIFIVGHELKFASINIGCPKLTGEFLEFFKVEIGNDNLNQMFLFDDGNYSLHQYLKNVSNSSDGKIYLTDFKNLVDWVEYNNPDNTILSGVKKFDKDFTFAIEKPAMVQNEKVLLCDKGIITSLDTGKFENTYDLKYYTESSGIFRELVRQKSDSLTRFFSQKIENYATSTNYEEIQRDNLAGLANSWSSNLPLSYKVDDSVKNSCIFTFNYTDREFLKESLGDDIVLLSIPEFMSKFDADNKDPRVLFCSLFPGKVIIWKDLGGTGIVYELKNFSFKNDDRPIPIEQKKPTADFWALPNMELKKYTDKVELVVNVLDKKRNYLKISETVGSSPCKDLD